jgi:hypothetical protein
MTTAQIIAAQIGNGTFAMLGAHSIAHGANALSFKVRGSKKCKAVKVTYEAGTDLYTIEGWKMEDYLPVSIGRHEGIAVEQMHETIERLTGLYTRL